MLGTGNRDVARDKVPGPQELSLGRDNQQPTAGWGGAAQKVGIGSRLGEGGQGEGAIWSVGAAHRLPGVVKGEGTEPFRRGF